MPIVFGPIVGFLFGALLGWLGLPHRTSSPAARKEAERVVAAYAGFVFAPALGYFVAFAGDWTYAYLLDSSRVPSAVELGFVVVSALALVGGHRALRARDPRDSGRIGPALAIIGAPLLLLFGGLAVLGDRFAVDATLAEWRGEFGKDPVIGGWLGWALLWVDGVTITGLVVAARRLRAPAADAAAPNLGPARTLAEKRGALRSTAREPRIRR